MNKEFNMAKMLGSLCWLVFAALFGFAWMVVFPWTNQGIVGNVMWAVVTLVFFCILQFGVGTPRRVAIWFGGLSVLSAVVTLQGPSTQWPLASWIKTTLPPMLQFGLPQSDGGLFFSCFLLLALLTLVLPFVRRALVPPRARNSPFDL